jgi:hypothetical protein
MLHSHSSVLKTKSNNIPIEGLSDRTELVSLKWLRGANRYNNGTTRYGSKYRLRLIMGWAGQRKIKPKTGGLE